MNLAETYDHIAEDWHRDHSQDDWWKEGTDTFIAKLAPGARVLDVGCGSGVKSKYLIDHGLSVTGIDFSEKLLAIARREVPTGDFRLVSMENLDSMSETFDAVFAQASLLHIPKKDAAYVVAGMAGRLNPGGFLYIAVKEIRQGGVEEEVKKENDYDYEYERFFSYFTLPELEAYLQTSGLTVVWKDRKPSGKTVWLQILGKK